MIVTDIKSIPIYRESLSTYISTLYISQRTPGDTGQDIMSENSLIYLHLAVYNMFRTMDFLISKFWTGYALFSIMDHEYHHTGVMRTITSLHAISFSMSQCWGQNYIVQQQWQMQKNYNLKSKLSRGQNPKYIQWKTTSSFLTLWP